MRFEVNNMVHVSSCKTVDCLPVVSDGEEVRVTGPNQRVHEPGHSCRSVLKLINKDMTELRSRIRVLLHNVAGSVKHVREVDPGLCTQFSLIPLQDRKGEEPEMLDSR